MNIFVTGASAGIGRSTCLKFAEAGHQVLAVARRSDALKNLDEMHTSIKTAQLDINNASAFSDLVQSESDFFSQLDVLVNNAGLALGQEAFQESTDQDIETMIQTNISSLFRITRSVLPQMISRKKGHIINLGSIAGHTAYKGGSVYCATKAAVHMFSEALRSDLGGTGLRVSTIAPGRVETEFSEVRYKGDKEKAKKVYQGFRPLSSNDIADSIYWMATQPEHVNIQHVVIMGTDQPNATTVVPLES